ncbi:MAG: hypothetical protein R3F19_33265 [Verrucomicrobiales bacterium]
MERQSVTTDKASGIINDANLWATEKRDSTTVFMLGCEIEGWEGNCRLWLPFSERRFGCRC